MAVQKKKRYIWIILALLIVIIAIAAVALLGGRPASAQYTQTSASTGSISTSYSFTGHITAPRSQTIAATESATVKEIYVAANDTVQIGDKLIKLSTGELIKAETAGDVVRLNVQKNDAVASGDELMTIMDVNQLEVVISIDEYDVGAVELGKKVDITINALDSTCEGVIKSLDKDASIGSNISAYAATVSFEAPEGVLPGMQVEVRILNKSAENATLIKTEAVQFDDENRAYVLTKSGESYVQTYVETGISDGTNVQILSGIQNGTAVYYPASTGAAAINGPGGFMGGRMGGGV